MSAGEQTDRRQATRMNQIFGHNNNEIASSNRKLNSTASRASRFAKARSFTNNSSHSSTPSTNGSGKSRASSLIASAGYNFVDKLTHIIKKSNTSLNLASAPTLAVKGGDSSTSIGNKLCQADLASANMTTTTTTSVIVGSPSAPSPPTSIMSFGGFKLFSFHGSSNQKLNGNSSETKSKPTSLTTTTSSTMSNRYLLSELSRRLVRRCGRFGGRGGRGASSGTSSKRLSASDASIGSQMSNAHGASCNKCSAGSPPPRPLDSSGERSQSSKKATAPVATSCYRDNESGCIGNLNNNNNNNNQEDTEILSSSSPVGPICSCWPHRHHDSSQLLENNSQLLPKQQQQRQHSQSTVNMATVVPAAAAAAATVATTTASSASSTNQIPTPPQKDKKRKGQKEQEKIEKLQLLVSYLKSGSSQQLHNPIQLEEDEIELAKRYKSHPILCEDLFLSVEPQQPYANGLVYAASSGALLDVSYPKVGSKGGSRTPDAMSISPSISNTSQLNQPADNIANCSLTTNLTTASVASTSNTSCNSTTSPKLFYIDDSESTTWTNPQTLATWIDNEVNSLVHDLEAKSQLVKQSKVKRKWQLPGTRQTGDRRNSSGAHST